LPVPLLAALLALVDDDEAAAELEAVDELELDLLEPQAATATLAASAASTAAIRRRRRAGMRLIGRSSELGVM
jgi:hypothetical protein